MKMDVLQPSQGVYDFDHADAIVDWARANGKQVHGHTLIWCADEWAPGWLLERSWTRAELLAVMEDHIQTVMDHFEGRVTTWDVVNEPLEVAGPGRRDCVWQRVIGDDWVQRAFEAARAADPAAKLFLNEYAADAPGPKFDALEALARELPLDGVGLQNHTYGFAPLQYETESLIARLGALGLQVHISELNVPTLLLTGDKLAAAGPGLRDDRRRLRRPARVHARDDMGVHRRLRLAPAVRDGDAVRHRRTAPSRRGPRSSARSAAWQRPPRRPARRRPHRSSRRAS